MNAEPALREQKNTVDKGREEHSESEPFFMRRHLAKAKKTTKKRGKRLEVELAKEAQKHEMTESQHIEEVAVGNGNAK